MNTNTVSAHQLQKSPGCCTSQLSPAHIACNLTSSSLPIEMRIAAPSYSDVWMITKEIQM